MMNQERLWSLITADEAILLHSELLKRAASGYEQVGRWREAAECWAEQGDPIRAGALYARAGDLGRAARTWLEAGRYHEALSAYQQLAQRPDANTLNQIRALLGLAACHLLATRGSLSQIDSAFSRDAGRQAYRQARKLLAQVTKAKVTLLTFATCWEALGDYGEWLGRYDLVQEGYERALEVLELSEERTQQARICRAYLAQARVYGDRLLCRQLEERLAAWPEEEKRPVIAPFPVEKLRLQRTLTGHTGSVNSVVISPDGQILISGSADKMIKMWELSTGKETCTLTGHTGSICTVAISLDGRTLVSGGWDQTIKVWDLSTGEEEIGRAHV